jgi:hypothetical protein
MRKALILGLACLALSGGVALAQQGGREKQRPPPPRPPVARCPDLALGAYAYVSAVPGGDPLAPDEVALQWNVSNGGNAPYAARSAEAQSLSLEYISAGGVQQLAATPIPQQSDAASGVSLGQGQSWRGYLRAHMPPEARRRTLRLRIAYGGDGRLPPNDCDTANNEVVITRPPG